MSGAPDVCDLSYGSSKLLSKCTGGFRMKKCWFQVFENKLRNKASVYKILNVCYGFMIRGIPFMLLWKPKQEGNNYYACLSKQRGKTKLS